MKKTFWISLFIVIASIAMAQGDLYFDGEHVKSVSFLDYNSGTTACSDYKCLLLFVDSTAQIVVNESNSVKKNKLRKKVLIELQSILNELGQSKKTSVENLDINLNFLKKSRKQVPPKYQSLIFFDTWLQRTFPFEANNKLSVSSAHNPNGIKIVVSTDERVYYFDMLDAEAFQPYWMRTSDKDNIKSIVNFNVNKHLVILFNILKIPRKVPWRDEMIDLYSKYCSGLLFTR
ncbi:MAG: hypothetical protein J5711_04585 [Bacteroidales bacterium]|nr:hypothetical protein [Bacteroidales bacterium]